MAGTLFFRSHKITLSVVAIRAWFDLAVLQR
jgi:hypothetical protein